MCPPIPGVSLLAAVTIAMAFHLTIDLILRSISRSPGYFGCFPGNIVFTNGVLALKGKRAPFD